MSIFDTLQKGQGGFIFLSHSHDDIIKVREIRNSLEAEGFEPLCFYLKCLESDEEVASLIKREIDAREWFIFLNSENSRKSRWVQMERDYITSNPDKKILTIDLDDIQSISNAIHTISHNLRIYIASHSADRTIVSTLQQQLQEKDYLVCSAVDCITGSDWLLDIESAIVEASQDGCVIVLLTQNSVNSKFIIQDVEIALQRKGCLIPVIVGHPEVPLHLQYLLCLYHHYYLSETPTPREIRDLVDGIGKAITSLHKNNT